LVPVGWVVAGWAVVGWVVVGWAVVGWAVVGWVLLGMATLVWVPPDLAIVDVAPQVSVVIRNARANAEACFIDFCQVIPTRW